MGVDAMGSDSAPLAEVQGAVQAAHEFGSKVEIGLVGAHGRLDLDA